MSARSHYTRSVLHFFTLLLTFSAALLLLNSLYRRGSTLDVDIIAAIALLTITLIVTFRLLLREEKIEDALRHQLQTTLDLEQETESELHTLEVGYRELFNNNPVPMWIFDLASLRILSVNAAAVAQYRYSRNEFLSMSIRDLRSESDARKLDDYLTRERPRLNKAGVWRHQRKDGTAIDVEVISHDLRWHGRRCRLVAAFDVTERLRAEQALQQVNLNLESMVHQRTERLEARTRQLHRRKRQLEALNTELEAFTYSASHDLRTPLFVLNTFTQMLLDEHAKGLNEEGRGYLLKIRDSVTWMSALIDDLLRLAQANQKALQRAPVDLSTLAVEIAARHQSRETGRSVSFQAEPGIVANADPALMKIVLDNLIGNAWKFTSRTSDPHILFGVQQQDGRRVLCLRDNGAGFDMQKAGKLFSAFHRLHSEAEFTGTGIGLATVQRIIKRHGGRIWAEAQVGKGAAFFFTLGRHGPGISIPHRRSAEQQPASRSN